MGSGVLRSEAFARYLPEFGVAPVIVCETNLERCLGYGKREGWRDDPRWPEVVRVPWLLDVPRKPLTGRDRFVRRLPIGGSIVRRLVLEAAVERVLPAARELVARHRPSVIYASFPPDETVLIADALGRETGIPFVLDFRDVWVYGHLGAFRHWLDFLWQRWGARRILRRASRVIANTPCAQNVFVAEFGLLPDKVITIPNGYDEGEFSGIETGDMANPREFLVVHAGTLYGGFPPQSGWKASLKRALKFDYCPHQCLWHTASAKWFLEAAERLLDNHRELRDVLHITFVGAQDPDNAAYFRAFRYQQCLTIKGPVSHQAALKECARADLLVLFVMQMYLREKDCCTAVASKVYDYLRCGRRILACTQPGDTQELVERFGAGVAVLPTDTVGIERALLAEIDRWRNGQVPQSPVSPSQLQAYERRNLTKRLAQVLREAAAVG
jgi:glycosyltransferase involved in cell wall biosynthesis